jgi:hypothetical protein
MMVEQQAPAVVDDVAARGEVSRREVVARERRLRCRQQLEHRLAMAGFQLVGGLVPVELREERLGSRHQCDGNQ